MKKIQPILPGGLRDYLPEEQIARQEMLDKIRAVFETFGFVPLDTPVLEKEAVLTGGDKEFKKQIFKIKSSEKLALRFDLTVPLARVVASNEISRPFKRYQIGKVWRGESQQFGRYREFTQCDADIVGSSTLLADNQMILLIYETLLALGLQNFRIKINNRKILADLYQIAQFPKKLNDVVLRAIDKLDKQGWEKIRQELQAAGIADGSIAIIEKFTNMKAISDIPEAILKFKSAAEGVKELKVIESLLNILNIPKDKYVFDFSVVRGLGYYTGIVYEATLLDAPEVGSVAGGGRYDGLVERFTNVPVPAVGVSIGIDRLFAALEKLGKIVKRKTIADVLVLNFDKSCEDEVLKIASDLRHSGIKTDLYLGKEETFKGQFAYGVSHEYPALVIFGSKEKERGIVQVKNMKKHEQIEAPSDELVGKVKELVK